MDQLPASSTNTATPAKRKRSNQACRSCRMSKRRCDAARPSCGSCANSSSSRPCVYDDPQQTKAKQSKLIERLQQRINDLERADGSRKVSSTDLSGIGLNSFQTEPQETNVTGLGTAAHGDGSAQEITDKASHAVASPAWNSGVPDALTGNFNLISPSTTPVVASQPSKGTEAFSKAISASFISDESSQPDSTRVHQPRAPRLSSIPLAFERDEIYLDQEKELPPNDEIGVVAPRFGYFGDSSAVTFMSQVRSVLDNADDVVAHYETEPGSPAHLTQESSGGYQQIPQERRFHSNRRCADLELYALPSREHADALLEVYWVWVHSIYPYLDRPDFEQRYEKIWLGSKSYDSASQSGASVPKQFPLHGEPTAAAELGDRKTFYCTLNIVFALSCQFDPALHPGESRSSDIFWQRAKSLIEQDFNIFNEGSVSLIQALLLFGVYMQSTELSGGCWTVANVATSVAQVNGLHQINTGMFKGSLSEKELDLRKRVWSGCILLDRSLSMIYGRPSIMTSRAWIGDDLNLADTSERSVPPSGEGTLSYSEFFHHHSTLHDILGAILAEFYEKPPTGNENTAVPLSNSKGSNPNTFRAPVFIRRVNEGDFQSLLRFDTALLRWKSQLPMHLKISSGDNHTSLHNGGSSDSLGTQIAQLQAAVLHARFLHIRILLFRPLLLRALADFRKQAQEERGAEEKSSLHEMLLMQSSVLCISAAQELSKLITKNLERESTRLPEWWHIIFYLYTCATVILASQCCTPLREKIGETALQECWDECLNGLRTYQRCSRSARRCCRLLEIFDQRTKTGQYYPRLATDSRLATSTIEEDRQANTRMMATTEDFNMAHASFSADAQNSWPFDSFQGSQSANSLDAYFNSWTPTSTDMAFLTAIPFESGSFTR